MIERKFSDDSKELFGYHMIISDCKEWAVARSKFFGSVVEAVNVYEHFEEKGYNFEFSMGDVLYFRRKKQK